MEEAAWDERIKKNGGDFMQSAGWGAFQRALGGRVARLEAGGLAAQVIFRPLPLGANEGYVPMGPIPVRKRRDGDEQAFWRVADGAADRHTVFFGCDLLTPVPFLAPVTEKTRQPLRVLIIDIAGKDAGRLYGQFHPTLQQNIDRADRSALTVRREDGWEAFYTLYAETMRRHSLRPWHGRYIKTLWRTLAPLGMVEVWSAFYKGELLASNLYITFAYRATHLFAGSSEKKREAQAPHLLHFKAMSSFAERGFAEYDLGKVDRGALPGLTVFKERFGGETRTYPGNFRRVLRPLRYRLYTTLKTLR